MAQKGCVSCNIKRMWAVFEAKKKREAEAAAKAEAEVEIKVEEPKVKAEPEIIIEEPAEPEVAIESTEESDQTSLLSKPTKRRTKVTKEV